MHELCKVYRIAKNRKFGLNCSRCSFTRLIRALWMLHLNWVVVVRLPHVVRFTRILLLRMWTMINCESVSGIRLSLLKMANVRTNKAFICIIGLIIGCFMSCNEMKGLFESHSCRFQPRWFYASPGFVVLS